MAYSINYDMAVELLHRYLEKIHIVDKHKGTSTNKIQKLYALNQELKQLTSQLEKDGHDVTTIIEDIKRTLEKQYKYKKIKVYIDGAARGNDNPDIPNESGIGFVVYGDNELLHEEARYLGSTARLPRLRHEDSGLITEEIDLTNNTSEYYALLYALEYLLEQSMTAQHIDILSDSILVVNQVNMSNATRVDHLIRLRNCVQEMMSDFDSITINHIPREKNKHADFLVNQVLDKQKQVCKDS